MQFYKNSYNGLTHWENLHPLFNIATGYLFNEIYLKRLRDALQGRRNATFYIIFIDFTSVFIYNIQRTTNCLTSLLREFGICRISPSTPHLHFLLIYKFKCYHFHQWFQYKHSCFLWPPIKECTLLGQCRNLISSHTQRTSNCSKTTSNTKFNSTS